MEYLNILACIRSVPEEAIRLIDVDSGAALDLALGHMSRGMYAIQIDQNGITQIGLCIKDTTQNTTDKQLLENLQNGYYRTANSAQLSLNGYSLNCIQKQQSSAIASKILPQSILKQEDKKYLI